MKIRTKINSSFIVIFIVIMAIIAAAMGLYTTYVVKNNIYSYLHSSSRARAEHIRTFIQNQENTALILAASAVFRDLLKEARTSDQYDIKDEVVDKRLTRTVEADPQITEAFVLSAKGEVISSSNDLQEGVDKSKDDYFINAKTGVYVKDIYFSNTTNELNYTISAPIIDEDGTFLGVSVLRYLPNNFYSIVKNENGLGKTEENFLINKDHFFISPSLFLGNDVILKQKVETQNASDCYDPQEVDYVKNNGYSGLVEKFGAQLVEALDYRNINVIGTHAYIPETGWCLITKVDKADALYFRIPLTIINIIIILISMIIFSFTGFFLSRRITAPLKELELGTDKIKKGDLDYKVNINTKDEFATLGEAFNTMTTEVKSSRKDIDKKVEEQTKEIKSKAKELDDQKNAIINILEDVEKEKEKFEVASNKLSLATKSAQIGVWEWDVIKNVIIWDDQMYKIYGIKKGDFGGAYEAWQAGLHPDDKKPNDEAIQKALKGEKDFTPIFRVVWPSGDIRYVQAYSTVERDTSGKPIKMIGVNFDVTHEREVDKAKTEFVSLASHQLRTPLSAINWYTEMLMAGDVGKVNKEQMEYLNEVYTGSQRMVELVNALLNVSRLELGTFTISLEPVDVPALVKRLLKELKSQIDKKKEIITEIYSPNLPIFSADNGSLRMVLQNLLSNSVKYTGAGGNITVEVAIKGKGEVVGGQKINEDRFILRVADSGMGIPKGQQDKVFEKLFRADNARTLETEGTGLGLYVIKSIVDQSGGEIWFVSEENKGTTFVISYPLTGMKKIEKNLGGVN